MKTNLNTSCSENIMVLYRYITFVSKTRVVFSIVLVVFMGIIQELHLVKTYINFKLDFTYYLKHMSSSVFQI